MTSTTANTIAGAYTDRMANDVPIPEPEPDCTRFWLIRHALVEENARARLYGQNDVPLCPDSLVSQVATYRALSARLPRDAAWVVTPLSRTRLTAEAIWRQAGLAPDAAPDFAIEPGLMEQHLGEWQGLRHAELPARLTTASHPFWPIGPTEQPPGGESMPEVIARVGTTMERLADAHRGRDVVVVSHGGAIRAAVAHALDLDAEQALRLAIQNLSLTLLERFPAAWRVVGVDEVLGS